MFKDHAAAIVALGMIASMVILLALHGMKDETLLAILATGSVGIANQIAGVKKDSSTTIGDNATVLQSPKVTPVVQAPVAQESEKQ